MGDRHQSGAAGHSEEPHALPGPSAHRIRWRLWPADEPEPTDWLCDEDTGRLPAHLPRHDSATFGLFQHFGLPVEWSDILVREVEDGPDDLPCRDPDRSREPFLKRHRLGAF